MKLLLCGHTSFAAQGLIAYLSDAGHDVMTFSRGEVSRRDNAIRGPVCTIDTNPHVLAESFDALINYILLKDDTVATNEEYVRSLLRLCENRRIKHLIHISSISSYKSSVRVIQENSPVERIPAKKGSYGSLKCATDLLLMDHTPKSVKLTLIRPGFILGKGLVNPVVGTAVRLPWNRMMIIGNAESTMPMIGREQLHRAVGTVVGNPPTGDQETLVLVAPNSPTRREFIQVCCKDMGCGLGVTTAPNFAWFGAAVGGQLVLSLLGKGGMQPYAKLTARLPKQRFSMSATEKRLGYGLSLNWAEALVGSIDAQDHNYQLPYKTGSLGSIKASHITFVGYGKIVKQKHLPALKKLGFTGQISAYDVVNGKDASTGQDVQSLEGAKLPDSDLFVVASPGPAHIRAIEQIGGAKGTVLVEKPLAYSVDEIEKWLGYGQSRTNPVLVCHNYRLKENVRRAIGVLERYNSGRLQHVHVHFESPPVANSSSAWMRNERSSRTLLLDFSLHFLDLACMFGRGEWAIGDVRHTLDGNGTTALIDGYIKNADYGVSFLLRQGFSPRRARVLFNFQNYSLSLGFFPDTFALYMANDNSWLYKQEKHESAVSTRRKVIDKLTGRDSDDSHVFALAASLGGGPGYLPALDIGRVAPFYRGILEVSRRVYGH